MLLRLPTTGDLLSGVVAHEDFERAIAAQASMVGFFSKHAALRRRAERGDPEAQCNLGVFYSLGDGVEQNFAEAAMWYRRAAEQGNSMAQFNLARVYALGQGVPFDDAECAKWNRRAAEQGNVPAEKILGALYEEGRGVTQNYSEASRRYRRAAEHGDAEAQFCLGNLYESGRGVPQSDAEAVRWFGLAANQGHNRAKNNLAVMARAGRLDKVTKATAGSDEATLAKFDLTRRPITNALLRSLLGQRRRLETETEGAGLQGEMPLDPLPSELDDLIFVAIMVLAPQMLRVALESLGRLGDTLPLTPGRQAPRDAPTFLAYARLIAFALWAQVRTEGFSVQLTDLSDHLARYVYPGWPESLVSRIRPVASQLYDPFRRRDRPNTKEWMESTGMLAMRYIESEVNPTITKSEIERLLGVMFRSLASAVG